MPDNLPLHIQTLGGYADQTLVILHIATLRNGTGMASPADVRDVYNRLRLPTPANASNYLKSLAGEHLVMPPSPGSWALTPTGLQRIRSLIEGATDAELAIVGTDDSGATFADARHFLIPPELAPAQFEEGITRFLGGHPFDSNVFGISRFDRGGGDPIAPALEACRKACTASGLEFHIASDRIVEDLLFNNIAAAMWACRYGVAIFEDRVGEGLNLNVAMETGAMIATGRPCLLLKDVSAGSLPTDLVGHLYVEIDITSSDEVAGAITAWAKDRLLSRM